MFMGINISQSDDDVARQHRGSRVGHRDNVSGLAKVFALCTVVFAVCAEILSLYPMALLSLSSVQPPLSPPFPGPRTRGGVIPSARVMCVSACVLAFARMACVCLCACVCVRASLIWCVCVYVCLRACVPARVSVRVCVRVRVRMPCVCLHARMRVCIYVCACV